MRTDDDTARHFDRVMYAPVVEDSDVSWLTIGETGPPDRRRWRLEVWTDDREPEFGREVFEEAHGVRLAERQFSVRRADWRPGRPPRAADLVRIGDVCGELGGGTRQLADVRVAD